MNWQVFVCAVAWWTEVAAAAAVVLMSPRARCLDLTWDKAALA